MQNISAAANMSLENPNSYADVWREVNKCVKEKSMPDAPGLEVEWVRATVLYYCSVLWKSGGSLDWCGTAARSAY